MNMLRLPGTARTRSRAFHDLCDELGILVWQDFMFANFDYPIADEHFRATVEREAARCSARSAAARAWRCCAATARSSSRWRCSGSTRRSRAASCSASCCRRLSRESGVDALYVPSAPCGGELPFRPDRGIANYYGVGGYRRPLEDARRAGVRFAAECLAFSNVPAEETIEASCRRRPRRLAVPPPAAGRLASRATRAGLGLRGRPRPLSADAVRLDPAELRQRRPSATSSSRAPSPAR